MKRFLCFSLVLLGAYAGCSPSDPSDQAGSTPGKSKAQALGVSIATKSQTTVWAIFKKQADVRAAKSISDWKNEYMPECDGCSEMTRCGGFFSSAKLRYSDHIRPFTSTIPEVQV